MTHQYVVQDPTLKTIPNQQFATLMASVLQKGAEFRFQAAGFSMAPFIQDGDVITLHTVDTRRVQIGDVLAVNHPRNNRLVVHRVISRNGPRWLLKGDSCTTPDGWIEVEHIMGRIVQVERKGRPFRLGLGAERRLIAILSRGGCLPACVRLVGMLLKPILKKWII
jgi:signal peptidase I